MPTNRTTKQTLRLFAAAHALYTAGQKPLTPAALGIAQRAIAARYGFTLQGLRIALASATTPHFVARKLYL